MATVPIYDRSAVNAAPIGAPRLTSDASPGAFGGNIGQGLESLGDSVTQVAVRHKEQADRLAQIDYENQRDAASDSILYDQKNGALNKTGKDALGIHETALSEFDKKAGEIESKITSERVRQNFLLSTQQRRAIMSRTLDRHATIESKRYADTVYQSKLTNLENQAISNYSDPVIIAASIGEQQAAIASYAQDNGLPAEWVKAEQDKLGSRVHVGVIDRMLANDQDRTASAYFEANKELITGDDQSKIERVLEVGSLRGESQRLADAINVNAKSMAEALAEVRTIEDVKLRDATNERVKQFWSEKNQAAAMVRDDAFLNASSAIEGNGNLDLIKPGTWELMEPSQRHSLEMRSRQIREGVEPVTDPQVWVDFLDKSPQEVAAMTKADMLALRPKLDREAYSRALGMWNTYKDAATKGKSAALTSTLTFKDVVENTAITTGIVSNVKKDKWKDDDFKNYATFELNAARQVEQFEEAQGRKATQPEIQKIVDEMALNKLRVGGGLFSSGVDKSVFAMTEEERKKAYIPYDQIPTDSVRQIVERASLLGVYPSTQDIADAYAASKLSRPKTEIDGILVRNKTRRASGSSVLSIDQQRSEADQNAKWQRQQKMVPDVFGNTSSNFEAK